MINLSMLHMLNGKERQMLQNISCYLLYVLPSNLPDFEPDPAAFCVSSERFEDKKKPVEDFQPI